MVFVIKKVKNRGYDPKLVDLDYFEYVMNHYYNFNKDLEAVRVDNYLGKTSFGRKYDDKTLKSIKDSHKDSVLEKPFLSGIMNIIQKRILDKLDMLSTDDVMVLSSTISWAETLKQYNFDKRVTNYVLPSRRTPYTEHEKLLGKNINTLPFEKMITMSSLQNLIIYDIFYLHFEDADCEMNFQQTDCFKYARNNYINHNDFLLKQVDFALNHLKKGGNFILMIPGVTNQYTLNIIQHIAHHFSMMIILDDQQLLHRDKIIFSTTILFKHFKDKLKPLPLEEIYNSPKKKEKLPKFAKECTFTCTNVPTISFLDNTEYTIDFYEYNNRCLSQLFDLLCKAETKQTDMSKYYAIYLAKSVKLPIKKEYGLQFYKDLLTSCITNETMRFEYDIDMTKLPTTKYKFLNKFVKKLIPKEETYLKYTELMNLLVQVRVPVVSEEYLQLKELQYFFNKKSKFLTLNLKLLEKNYSKIIKSLSGYRYVKFFAPTYPVTDDTFFIILDTPFDKKNSCTKSQAETVVDIFLTKFIQYINFKKLNRLFVDRDFLDNYFELWELLGTLRKKNYEDWIKRYVDLS